MRRRALLLCLILLPFPDAAFAFIRVERTPCSLADLKGFTSYWNDSYILTIDDMKLRLVTGIAQVSRGTSIEKLIWDPEIVSVMIDDEEIMRRASIANRDYIDNDPLTRLPFLGIGGLASPYNYAKGILPYSPPPATIRWNDAGEGGLLSWKSQYSYSPGDAILWLNRTFILNSSLDVECSYWVTSDYTAIQQQIKVTNGELSQCLPFPLETAFSLGDALSGKAISLPNMTLSPERYLTYPRDALPEAWYNESFGAFILPEKMWKGEELPGMLYVEFDLADRDWFGMCALTSYSFQPRIGVGVKIISTDMPSGFRPYCIFVSGEDDHVIIGFKPFDVPGPYGDFVPATLAPRETVSLDLVWFFPQAEEDTMSISDLTRWGDSALSVLAFHANRTRAEELLDQANDLAREGKVDDAIEKAQAAVGIYRILGNLSDALFEEARKVNATISTWRSAAAKRTPHPEKGSRLAILVSTTLVLSLILALAAWIYVIEPRRPRKG